MSTMRWIWPLVLAVCQTSRVAAAEIVIPLMSRESAKVPVIDGVIHEEEWEEAFRGVGLVDAAGQLAARQATWWLGTDGKRLFIALRTETPPQGTVLGRISSGRRDTVELVNDDALEVWMAPTGPGPTAPPYFQFMGNPKGAIYDVMFDPSQSTPSQPWDGAWEFHNSINAGWWESEVAIPLEHLVKKGIRFPDAFGFRIARDWKQPFEYASTEGWSGGGFADPSTMSHFTLAADAPRIQMLSLGNWMEAALDLRLALANPTAQRRELRVKVEVASTSNMPPCNGEETLTLEPGQRKEFRFQRQLFKGVDCTAALTVSSPAEGRTWLSREWKFRTAKPETIWTTVAREKKAADLLFAYSPYRNQIRSKVDFSGMREADGVRQAAWAVWAEGGSGPLAQATVEKFTGHVGETIFDVPDLKDGRYELRCSLEGKTALKDAVVKTFERKHFEWEHNPIGISEQVVEPFQPLKVDGPTVKAIFRDYELNALGLCQQIRSEGKPLLAAPMELGLTIAGKPVTLKAGKLKLVEKKPSRVMAETGWNAGGIRGVTRTRFDYDGMMEVELELNGAADAEMDRLDLVVPLHNTELPLMYAIGAGIRGNYAGRIPEGEGEIWNNTRATTYGLPNKFLPYLWLGGVRRGLAWYADNDRDWVRNGEEPEIVLIRQGTTCKLVFHLIGKPTPLERPRRFTFAFQATPVKPRPADWRNWTFDGGFPGSHPVRIWGSCFYWGAVSAFGDVYPRDRDYRFLERLVAIVERGSVSDEDRAFLAKWNEGYRQKKHQSIYVAHTTCAMNGSAARTVPYTNARGVRQNLPEFQIFQDEWVTDAYTPRSWADEDLSEVVIEPVPSHQDYALWYYQKLMSIGYASGIYWDNSFPAANYNPFASPEAADFAAARNHPGVGITSMRNLIKRTAVMYRLAGRVPHSIAHMTNGAVIPMLAFTTIALDWEMKYGAEDFQDRFKEDFIFASTLGEQAGTVPLVLSGINSTKEKTAAWLTRTLLGVTLVYEIKVWYNSEADQALVQKIGNRLGEFGYGQSDCRVYRYWEQPPFQPDRQDVRSLLLARNGKLLLINTDFGEGGPCRLQLDLKTLGIASPCKATNAETNEPVECRAGRLQFDLKRHDFNMILVEPAS